MKGLVVYFLNSVAQCGILQILCLDFNKNKLYVALNVLLFSFYNICVGRRLREAVTGMQLWPRVSPDNIFVEPKEVCKLELIDRKKIGQQLHGLILLL